MSKELCGVLNPQLVHGTNEHRSCRLPKGHHGNHNSFGGYGWTDPGQVSGNRPRQYQDEQLRELLSYCKTQDGRFMKPHEAYHDVAGKLAKILDGEQ